MTLTPRQLFSNAWNGATGNTWVPLHPPCGAGTNASMSTWWSSSLGWVASVSVNILIPFFKWKTVQNLSRHHPDIAVCSSWYPTCSGRLWRVSLASRKVVFLTAFFNVLRRLLSLLMGRGVALRGLVSNMLGRVWPHTEDQSGIHGLLKCPLVLRRRFRSQPLIVLSEDQQINCKYSALLFLSNWPFRMQSLSKFNSYHWPLDQRTPTFFSLPHSFPSSPKVISQKFESDRFRMMLPCPSSELF